MLKDLEKIEKKNKQINRENVNLFKRENRNVNKLNVEIFKLNKNKQKLLENLNILRMNSTTTSIFSHVDKFKTDNVKLVNRNIELQNEMNSLKNKTSSTFNLRISIDKKDKSVKMTNFFKFSENIFDLSYEI